MSGTASSQSGLTRRGFLKGAGAAAGALSLAGVAGMTATTDWLAPAPADAAPQEEIRYARHVVNCGNRCHLKCTVRDGRLCKIEPSLPHDDVFSRCCHRGISEIERVYSPTRLQTPLKRVGERGAGEFVAITWDEALDEVAESLKKVLDEHGPEAVLIYGSTGSTIEYNYQMLPKFIGCAPYQGHSKNGIDMAIANSLTVSGVNGGYSNVESWVHSDVVINCGQNILESSLQDTRFFFKAKAAGAKIITFDTRYTVTAQKSSQWIPIAPGSDAAIWLAMEHELIERELYDEEYTIKNTSAAHLVDMSTGKKVVAGESVAAVWDSVTNAVVPFDDANATPELFKTVEVDGKEYKTVMTLLKESSKDYTLEWASEKSGVSVEVLEGFLSDLTREKVFVTFGLGGLDKYTNSDIYGHAVAICMALTNHLAGLGNGLHNTNGHSPDWNVKMGSYKIPEEFKAGKLKLNAAAYPHKENYKGIENPIQFYLCVGNAIQQMWSDSNAIGEWLKTIEKVVVVDAWHCTSVDWADIVLPAAPGFESEEDIRWYGNSRSHAWLSQKVVDPLFEAKTDYQIEHELLERLGFGEYLPESKREFIEAAFDTDDEKMEGITIDSLLQNGCIQRLNVPNEPFTKKAYDKGEFASDCGKVEFYHECQYKHGQAVPQYVPLMEVESDEVKAKYPMHMLQHHSRFKIHSSFGNAAWLREFYSPAFEICSADAEKYGLKTGDIAEVYNDRGSVKAAVRVNDMSRPGEIAISSGWWNTQMEEGTLGNVGNDTLTDRHWDLPIGPMIPFMDTQVAIRKA